MTHYRHEAKVDTFDQAASACMMGKSRSRLMVMNNSDDLYIWIGSDAITFWAPKFVVYPAGKR